MKIAPLAALALALTASGCMTLEERRALDMEQCRGYGFRQGTDAFAQCMQTIDVERAAARRTYVYQDFGGFYGGYGFGYGYRRWCRPSRPRRMAARNRAGPAALPASGAGNREAGRAPAG